MLLLLLPLLSLSSDIVLSDIAWFKETEVHQQNVLQLSDGWVDCPGWSPTSDATEIQLDTIFGTVTRVRLPAMKNDAYNFTAKCITMQVPLAWDDPLSTATIDYHLAHIFAANNADNSNGNGAFWILNGGPGGDGQQLYFTAVPWLTYIDATYDLYIPDHRGTGYSNPIQCPTDSLANMANCVDFINETYGNDLHYFSTYAASMDLGYAIDLFIENLTLYQVSDTVIYGISYGTYYLNTYLYLFPNQSNAAILDGLCPPDQCRIIDYDMNANAVGINFVNLCGDDVFCKAQFNAAAPYQSMQELFEKIVDEECVAGYSPIVLRQIFFSLLTDFYNRILIPPILYRLDRCNDNDKTALNKLLDVVLSGNVSSNMSIALGINIILSELWDGLDFNVPGKDLEQLIQEEGAYYVSSGISVTYRVWWDVWNRYAPNQDVYGEFADPPIPMLLLNGNLDPQTPHSWALHAAQQYNANINDDAPNEWNRYYYTVPNTPHFVMFRSPIINSTQQQFETCGFLMMKSFIDRENNWMPNSECVNWIEPTDWSGTKNISKLLTMQLFGTADLWEIEEEEAHSDTAFIWVIIIGCIIIIIEMALFAYFDYKKQKNLDVHPLLDATKESTFSDRY